MGTFFNRDQSQGRDVFIPTTLAAGKWGDMVRGPAAASLLARALQTEAAAGLIPARTTFDLHSPVPFRALRAEARVLRRGRRLQLIDADLLADDRVVARARSLWLLPNPDVDVADNRPWMPARDILPPAEGPWHPGEERRLFWSEPVGWTDDSSLHRNSDRKAVWHLDTATVDDEAPSPFERAATIGDVSNLAVGWGQDGIDFINADVTLSLSRLPTGSGAGVVAVGRTEHTGIAVGSTVLFDREGEFGTGSVTTLVQPGNRVRFYDHID